MLFSVIVPIYNAQEFLPQCIESILEQTFADFEVILVNDGSNDNSAIICDEYANSDSRVKVIHKINGGVVSARKEGLANAIGDYIVSVDSDDYIDKDLLKELSLVIRDNDSDVIAYNAIVVSGDNRYILRNKALAGDYKENIEVLRDGFMYDISDKSLNFGTMLFSLWSKAIKRTLINRYQFEVPNFISKGDDLAVIAPIVYNTDSIMIIDEALYYYRINENSIMRGFDESNLAKIGCLFGYLRKYCNCSKYYENMKMCALTMIVEHCCGAAKTSANYKAFKTNIKALHSNEFFSLIDNTDLRLLSKKEAIKIASIRNCPWLLYLFYRIPRKRE